MSPTSASVGYFFPTATTNSETTRLNLQHKSFILILSNRLSLAPTASNTSTPLKVLDLACGTGIWAEDFARRYPNSTVLGSDLVIPEKSTVANCSYVVANAEEAPWTFAPPGGGFDIIHARMTVSCFDDREKVLKAAYDALKPGGYLELQDCNITAECDDGSVKGTALERYVDAMAAGARAVGRNMSCSSTFKDLVAEVGFTEVTEEKFKLPWSPWSDDPVLKEVGKIQTENAIMGGQIASYMVMKYAGYTLEENQDMFKAVKEDLKNMSIKAWMPMFVVIGRKPL